ncbi:beta-amylase, partial [Haematococcus lacustris]
MGSQSLGDLGSRWTAPWAHSPIDVFVMLPLSMVDADGVFRAAPWFGTALSVLAASGVRGVAVDVWWGLVEREPQCYCWAGYEQLFDLIKGKGLQIQVVMSFHACGGNVGDTAQIPLPAWVLQCGEHDPDLFFTDRPREGAGRRNREYLSIWADEAAALRGRTPLQCYEDFMQAFCNNFHQLLGSSLVDIVVGAGPCGELRYPAYVESNGWKFPGVGEFQCYDRRALACLAQAAREAGHPEWGYGGPHNAGDYASWPEDTDFFRVGGAWETEYGRFFLGWYSACLLRHADQLLAIAKRVLLRAMAPPTPPEAPPGTHCPPP